jgi:hypothetical protein
LDISAMGRKLCMKRKSILRKAMDVVFVAMADLQVAGK